MIVSKLDDRGRLLIAKETRDKYGDEFVVVEAPGEVILLPVPKDALKALEDEGKKLPANMSISEIKKRAHERALKELTEKMQARDARRRRKR